ncbi:MAG: helix-hairpin-helix domain-containing protein [Clostridia bacterium]|nr:helix-hairpin-helix domain-containing protein [Clostridia bacterium]
MNINTADLEELTRLKGIGPATAESIIAERELNGPYYYPEDLLAIKGIGAKTLQKFADKLQFD